MLFRSDMVKNGEIEILKNLFSAPIPLIDYVLNTILSQFDLKNAVQKDTCLKESLAFLHQLSPVIQEEYKSWLAQRLNLPSHLIKVQSTQKFQNPAIQDSFPADIASTQESFYGLAEKIIIKSILEDMSLLDFVLNYLEPQMFHSQTLAYQKLLQGELESSPLIGILLDSKIKAQTKENLKQQIIMILYRYYDEQRKLLLQNSSLSLREKSFLLRKYQKYLEDLKKGDLALYESVGTF